MLKVQKNDKAYKELAVYATKQGLPLKEVLLSDAHLEEVTKVFYAHMPKLVKWSMKFDTFKEFYKSHREAFVGEMKL